MLAKPEYFSPPDEVCCWLGHRGGAAGKERRSGRDAAGRGRRGREWEAGTATSSGKASNLPEGMHHREDAAGRGAAAKSDREDAGGRGDVAKHDGEDAAGRGAMAELLLARELQRSSIGKLVLAWAPWRMLLTRAAGGTAGENSRQQQTGNGHLTEQARNVNLTKQAQDAILAGRLRKGWGREKGIDKTAASRRVSKLAA